MACYVVHVVLLFAVVGHTLAMNTCSEKVGNTLLEDENLDGSYLEDLAGISYWAGLGVEPDKSGFTSIVIQFSKLASNARGEKYLTPRTTRTFNNMLHRPQCRDGVGTRSVQDCPLVRIYYNQWDPGGFVPAQVTKDTANTGSSVTFDAVWTQQGRDRFFATEYLDGQYNIYHFYYKGLIVFHRCSVVCIKDGNVSFTVFAPIGRTKAQVKTTLQELEVVLRRKFPNENLIYLEYPVINFTTNV